MARETQVIVQRAVMTLLAGLFLGGPLLEAAQTAAVTNTGIAPVPAETKAKETLPGEPKPAEGEAEEKKEAEPVVTKLLGDKGLEGFYTWIAGAGVFVDPK
jgi:hypothetical protein